MQEKCVRNSQKASYAQKNFAKNIKQTCTKRIQFNKKNNAQKVIEISGNAGPVINKTGTKIKTNKKKLLVIFNDPSLVLKKYLPNHFQMYLFLEMKFYFYLVYQLFLLKRRYFYHMLF